MVKDLNCILSSMHIKGNGNAASLEYRPPHANELSLKLYTRFKYPFVLA